MAFSKKILKVRKRFNYDGIELRIVTMEEPFNDFEVQRTRVVGPNGGVIPVSISHRQTLKSITEATKILLDSFKKRGADVKRELTRKL